MCPGEHRPQCHRFHTTCRKGKVLRELGHELVEYLGTLVYSLVASVRRTLPRLDPGARRSRKACTRCRFERALVSHLVLSLSKQFSHVWELSSEGMNLVQWPWGPLLFEHRGKDPSPFFDRGRV